MLRSLQVGAGESPREACGLFGVWGPGEDVARLIYFGLFALQHRGQESAGMAVSDGSNILVYRELGLVSQVFSESTLATLQGHLGIGHTRYSTTGSTTWENAQPSFKTDGTRGLALGHNGNLVNTAEVADRVGSRGRASSDSDLVATLLARESGGLEEAALEVLPLLRGAFSFVLLDERTIYGVRDPHGLRPLAIGRLPNGFVLASETAALDIVGAAYVREVEPGEMVMIDDRGLRSVRFAESPRSALCLFEFVYLARPDSRLLDRSVHVLVIDLPALPVPKHLRLGDIGTQLVPGAPCHAIHLLSAVGIRQTGLWTELVPRACHLVPSLGRLRGPSTPLARLSSASLIAAP
jgi:amidophosphoribosyltransferase